MTMTHTTKSSGLRAGAYERRKRGRRHQEGGLASRVSWVVLTAWGVFALFPLIWLLLAMTKSETDIVVKNPFSFGSFGNVVDAWHNLMSYNDGAFLTWVLNSVIQTGLEVVLTIAITIPAAYALGSKQFALRKTILILSLGLMLMPVSSMVLPLFLEMNVIGLIGSMWAVILPLSVFPFGLYVGFIYFSTSVGRDIYDAARIDGCGEWAVFRRIALPLAKPIVGLIAFFSFMRGWNEFVLPFVMLGSNRFPLPLGLTLLSAQTPFLAPPSNVIPGMTISTLLLAVLLTALPVAVGILAAQRVVIKGSAALGGGLKG